MPNPSIAAAPARRCRESRPLLASLGLAAVLAVLAVLVVTSVTSAAPGEVADPRALARRGQYEEAEALLRRELKRRPDLPQLRRGLAETLEARGRYEEALEVLAAVAPEHDAASLRCAEGRIRGRTGDLEKAEAAYRAALKLDGRDVEALTRLGEVLLRRGQRTRAEELWNRVVEIYQDLDFDEAEKTPAEVFVEMGVALVHLNRFHDANEVMFAQAEEQDPECPRLLLEWGRTFFRKYNFPDSRGLYREALTANPYFADARVELARNYLTDFQVGTRRYELAEKQIEKALAVNPRHAGAYAARGRLWLSDGNLPRARSEFERSLEIDGSSLETLGQLGATLYLMEAHEDFEQTVARAGAIQPRPAEFWHTIATAIEQRFRYDGAVEMCQKALELDPEYWPAYHTIAINYLRTGKEELGREFLQKSYEKDPFNVWVFNTRKLLAHMDREHVRFESEHFRFSFPRSDRAVLEHFLVPVLEEAYARLSERYRVELPPVVHVDVFSNHQWFSARIVGLGGFPATGACFGRTMALTTAKALPQNWGAVAWHEFAHVVTLQATGHRVPRWLTEGISVWEEGHDHPAWTRNFQRQIADARGSRRLLPLADLDFGFSKPKYPQQVLISYFQGCLIVSYIVEKHGFEKVLEVLHGYRDAKTTARAFRDVFGLSLEQFDKGFFAWLDRWVKATGYAPAIAEDRIADLELAVESDPEDIAALVDLAWAYHGDGNDVDAPLTARKVLALDPENGDARAILGFEALRAERTKEARESLEKALEKGTRFRFRAHEALARIALKAGERKAAIEQLEKAKQASPVAGAAVPPRGNVYDRLAALYSKEKREKKVIEQYDQLRRLAPEDGVARQKLANYWLARDDDESVARAYEVLQELVYIQPFALPVHQKLAALAARLGHHETTVREYRYLLGVEGFDRAEAYRELARASLALGRRAEAVRHARRLLELDPDSKEARELIEKAAGEKAAGEKAAGEKAAGEKAAGEKAAGKKAAGEKAAGEKGPGENAGGA